MRGKMNRTELTQLWLRRAGARAIDLFVVAIASLLLGAEVTSHLASSLVSAFVFLILDSVPVWLFGVTLGKLIFKLRVTRDAEGSLSVALALKRSSLVFIACLACGTLILAPAILARSYKGLIENGKTLWDEILGTDVVNK